MNVNNSFADRLKILRDLLEVKREEDYLEKMGITRNNFKSYSRGSQPSLDKLANILSSVKNLNSDWLVSGKGEMFKDGCSTVLKAPEEKCGISQDRLLNIIESQQETIKAQSRSIENLSKRGIATAEDVDTARVRKGS